MEQFREQLVVEFETYLNGQKIHHDDIAKGISEILHKSIGDAMRDIKLKKCGTALIVAAPDKLLDAIDQVVRDHELPVRA